MRLRLGVGHPGDKSQVTSYVLKRGSADVEAAIEDNIDEAMAVMPTADRRWPERGDKRTTYKRKIDGYYLWHRRLAERWQIDAV